MSMGQRRAGSITVNPPRDIQAGDTIDIALGEITVQGKERYLRKYLPFGAVVVDSYSGSVRLQASVDGLQFDPVPTNSARTFDTVPVENVYIRNPAGSGATVAAGDVELILFTTEAQTQQGPNWSLPGAVEDLVPGFSFGIRTDR